MALPSFTVAGTQKAAMTWLYDCLDEHPQVFVPETKELHDFCRPADCRVSRHGCGRAWSERQVAAARPGRRSAS